MQKHPLLRDVVADQIAEAIVEGRLLPGERLNEVRLAETLGVSRSPVREALRQLETDGLAVAEPRRGTTVTAITEEETVQFYECRLLMEVECIRLATPRLSDDSLNQLQQLFGEMSDVAEAGQLHDYLQLVAQFHEVVRSACPNAALVDLIGGLSRRSMRFRAVSIRTPSRVATSLNSHRELLAALLQRDPELATELTGVILTTSRDAIVASLREGKQAPGVSAGAGMADSTAA